MACSPSLLLLPFGRLDLPGARFHREDGEGVALTTREVRLLEHLAARPGEDVERDTLLVEVWGASPSTLTRAVDTTVARLRRKIERDPSSPEALLTAHGSGYRLVLARGEDAAVPLAPPRRRVLVLGDREVDLDGSRVRTPEGETPLTRAERALLSELARHPGSVVEPGALTRAAGITGGRAALANAVWRLRGKIEPRPEEPRHLVSAHGGGYRLDAEVTAPALGIGAVSETLWTIADHVGRVLGLQDCVVYARDGARLVQVSAYGPKVEGPNAIRNPITIPVGRGIVGTAARFAEPQCVADVRTDTRYIADAYPGRSELAVPILHGREVVGVLDSESDRTAAYGPSERLAFASLAAIASAAVCDLRRALHAA